MAGGRISINGYDFCVHDDKNALCCALVADLAGLHPHEPILFFRSIDDQDLTIQIPSETAIHRGFKVDKTDARMLMCLCPAMFQAALREHVGSGGNIVRGLSAVVCATPAQGLATPRYKKVKYGGIFFRPRGYALGSNVARSVPPHHPPKNLDVDIVRYVCLTSELRNAFGKCYLRLWSLCD